jgi:hypothetical protein
MRDRIDGALTEEKATGFAAISCTPTEKAKWFQAFPRREFSRVARALLNREADKTERRRARAHA